MGGFLASFTGKFESVNRSNFQLRIIFIVILQVTRKSVQKYLFLFLETRSALGLV